MTTPIDTKRLRRIWKRYWEPSSCTKEQHEEAVGLLKREMEDNFPALLDAADERDRLRTALEFYATANYSREQEYDADGNLYDAGPSEIERDYGANARAALEGK